MTVIFKAKTREGYSLKVLAELLQNNIKTACFEVDKKGIRLRMMDHHRTVLIDLELEADSFSVYKFNSKEKLYLGINLSHFHKMLRSIKKRDIIQMSIDDKNQTDLVIEVIPKENNRVTTSVVKIQTIQNIDTDIPEGYGKPVIVPSGEFQKMCKSLSQISKQTHITSRGLSIKFSCDAGGVMKRQTEFGEIDRDDDSDDSDDEKETDYDEEFNTEQLTKITKLSGLSNMLQIFPKCGNPLLFKTQVGTLGKISVYIKSKNMMDAESKTVEED
jgi:proliferating cell nuclear antigen